MKRLSIALITFVFVLSAGSVHAQKIKSGNFKALNGQTALNITYDYTSMAVGKYKNEKDYLEDGIADRNRKKPGSGDEWARKWANDKVDRFQPTFEQNLNKKLSDIGLTAKEGATDAQYTLLVKMVFLEQGFQSGVGMSRPAYINMVIDLVQTSAPDKILAEVVYDKIQSVNMMGYDYDTGSRVQSCFDRAGDNIGKLIVKNVSK